MLIFVCLFSVVWGLWSKLSQARFLSSRWTLA